MELKFSKRNRTLIIKIDGEIDHHTCEALRTEADRALEKLGGKNIIFSVWEVFLLWTAPVLAQSSGDIKISKGWEAELR